MPRAAVRSGAAIGQAPTAVVFDIGRVLYDWSPRFLYERLLPQGEALDAFLRDVVTEDWHFQHDAGRPFAETSAERAALYPKHADLIAAWGPRFLESIGDPIPGMAEIVDALAAGGVPLYAITNFSGEFFPAFRAREAWMFDRFEDIVVSGDEKLTKPDVAIYRLSMARFGLDPTRTVFIDDNRANIEGAAAIGLIALHFTDAATLRADLATLGLPTPR